MPGTEVLEALARHAGRPALYLTTLNMRCTFNNNDGRSYKTMIFDNFGLSLGF